jgi:hypothetical protein
MKTKEELIAQCKAENPVMIQTINDVQRELPEDEYNDAAEKWAEAELLRLEQLEKIAQAEAERTALLARLGITTEEAALLLGGTN